MIKRSDKEDLTFDVVMCVIVVSMAVVSSPITSDIQRAAVGIMIMTALYFTIRDILKWFDHKTL